MLFIIVISIATYSPADLCQHVYESDVPVLRSILRPIQVFHDPYSIAHPRTYPPPPGQTHDKLTNSTEAGTEAEDIVLACLRQTALRFLDIGAAASVG
jgi:hypothetical protein